MATNAIAPKETIYMQGFGDVPARAKHIASVHFEEMDFRDFWHSKNRSFRLPAGKMGEPSHLTVWDSQQWCTDETALLGMQAGMPKPQDIPKPVAVELIVGDLLNKWRPYVTISFDQKQLADLPPRGIMEVAGPAANAAEIATLNRTEETHCRAAVELADRFFRNGKGEITDYFRWCLTWLGSEKRDWFQRIEAGLQKKSAISGSRIPMEALADQGLPLIDFYISSGLDPMDFDDTFVADMMKKNPKIRETIERRLGLRGPQQNQQGNQR